MTPRFSLYLDFIRVLAAFVALLSHWAYPRFTDGTYIIIRELNLGSDAVMVFFVLSGLVISRAVELRDKTGGMYFFNRATRLYTVAAPALLLGFLFDRIGLRFDPASYDGMTSGYNPISFGDTLLHGLSLTSHWGWSAGVRLGTNGPWWSLSYEAAYYLLFGAFLFLKGPRRFAVLVLLSLVIGIKALLLMPAWLLGVAVWRSIRRYDTPDERAAGYGKLIYSGLGLVVIPLAAYVACLAGELPLLLKDMTGTGLRAYLQFSDEFIWNGLIGLFVALHLLGMARLYACADPREEGRCARAIRWLAGGSFSLYLMHYPALQFFDALMGKVPTGVLRDTALLLSVTAFCYLFAELFERPLTRARQALLSFRRMP